MFVVTLLANPDKAPLTQAFVDSMAPSLALQHIRAGKTEWRQKDAVCDLYVDHPSFSTLDAYVQDIVRDQPYDAVVQLADRKRKKLLIADMESTIITCECLDELAELVGLKDQIASITARAMNGEIEFARALEERVGLLQGLSADALQQVYDQKVQLMPGARELMAAMKKNGAYTMLVSGGFDFFTTRIKSRLGFDEERSNRLEIKNGVLTGKVILPILDKNSKLQALKDGCQKLGIDTSEAIAAGDGANDLPMLLEAGLGVAYHAKPSVRAQARARINHCDLSALTWLCH